MGQHSDADARFAAAPFLVRDAVAQGFGEDRFKHDRWHRPFRGVRSFAPAPANLRGRALHYLPRLRPGERFSHATALALLNCPIRVPSEARVDICSPERLGRVTCVGVTGHRHGLGAEVYPCRVPELEHWIPIAPPLEAVLQSASQLAFCELVIALDHFLLRDERRFDPWLHILPDKLTGFAERATGRGAVRFREAAALARVGAESRMETLMRLSHARAGGPELALQAEVYDAAGQWIGRFDGADEDARTLHEYDGEQHLFTGAQRRRDARKLQHARDAGWRVNVLYAEDLIGVSSLEAGRRMLAFSGRQARPVRRSLAKLLDERSGDDTEPTTSRRGDAGAGAASCAGTGWQH